jgi:hypothetical protein
MTPETGKRVYSRAVRIFSLVLLVLGLAILISTLLNGGGLASVGVLMGVAFIAVGGGRLWLSARMSP